MPITPRSPEALDLLRAALQKFTPDTRQRGLGYFSANAVGKVRQTDLTVTARVRGTSVYSVSWLLAPSKWVNTCSCPLEKNCKHAYATALEWFKECAAQPDEAPANPIARAVSKPTQPAKPLTFRETWTPVLAKKLGRPLTKTEGIWLDQLDNLHVEMKRNHGRVTYFALDRNGFGEKKPRSAHVGLQTAFEDWWPEDRPPTDPWSLWQYIAYDWQLRKIALPEVFAVMTDTQPIHAALEQRLIKRELDGWRAALRPIDSYTTNVPERSASGTAELVDLRLILVPGRGMMIEGRTGPEKPWKAPTQRWLNAIAGAKPADFTHLPPAAAALAIALAAERRNYSAEISPKHPLPSGVFARVLAYPATRDAILLPDGSPWRVEPAPLTFQAVISPSDPARLELSLTTPEGTPAGEIKPFTLDPDPLYEVAGRVYRGPPPIPSRRLPVAVMEDAPLLDRLRTVGLRLPDTLERTIRRVTARPVLRCWLDESSLSVWTEQFHAQLHAITDEPASHQMWTGYGGWRRTESGTPAPRAANAPALVVDLGPANDVGAHFGEFKLAWSDWHQGWVRNTTKTFPEDFATWCASLPTDCVIEAQGELAGLAGPPLVARLDFSAAPVGDRARDWFDLTVELKVSDTKLTSEEIALLLKARGKWVRLPGTGWRRLELATDQGEASDVLDRLGLHSADALAEGRPTTHRLHALQLAAEAGALEARDEKLAAVLRERATALSALPPPATPATLRAELRPYQQEGFQFLAHLSAHGFGGILADDMGLGKTVQTLAWLLHLAEHPSPVSKKGRPTAPTPFRALVVCPKSVVHGWQTEATRFAPTLPTTVFTPELAARSDNAAPAGLLIVNYTQLRLNADWFRAHQWDVVILDEAQFIKNPGSQVAVAARGLVATHRLALTGTPIENRLLDLWSLLAFAQPGLLGTQAAFKRHYDDEDPAAHARLRRRVRHFMLRRTKGQVATDLPPRIEDDLVVELEGEQRRLYDAELKRARAQLLGIETDRALDQIRFNILSSLLRLRQICCHPGLIDAAHRTLPSAKLEALMERLEELREEGHQVLVFSQFVGMLEIIQERLVAAGIGHLLLTGQTDDRAALVDRFQSDRSQTVFLLSLKAAGFGLNLTAASYAILYDPWWNPAVEAQAIDRAHRIGQTQPVVAYRLLGANTIEEKIRTLQREKAALAGAVMQEESLAQVLDLESLKQILS